jgi:hypothetical protein
VSLHAHEIENQWTVQPGHGPAVSLGAAACLLLVTSQKAWHAWSVLFILQCARLSVAVRRNTATMVSKHMISDSPVMMRSWTKPGRTANATSYARNARSLQGPDL